MPDKKTPQPKKTAVEKKPAPKKRVTVGGIDITKIEEDIASLSQSLVNLVQVINAKLPAPANLPKDGVLTVIESDGKQGRTDFVVPPKVTSREEVVGIAVTEIRKALDSGDYVTAAEVAQMLSMQKKK